MGSMRELLEIIALIAVTGGPLFVVCLCHVAKAADEAHGYYQRRRAER